MRKILLFAVLTAFLFSCTQAPDKQDKKLEKQASKLKKYTIEQFMSNISLGGSSFSPDESELLITSDESGIYNLYAIPVQGGEAKPLTDSKKESFFAISYFPNDKRILYSADGGGNEISHIFLRNEDGTTQDLTPDSAAKASFYTWARDQKTFFYATNKRDARFMDLYEMNIENFQSKLIFQNDSGLTVSDISKDKRYLVLIKTITRNNQEMYLYDRKTKEIKHISPHKGDASYSAVEFSIDNSNLFYLTDENSEFRYLMKYDIKTGKKEKVKEYSWDISYAYLSYNEKYMIVVLNEDGKGVVKVYELATDKEIPFPTFENGEVKGVGVSKSESKAVFYVGSSKSPTDLYIYDFETKKHIKLKSSLNPEINPDDLVNGKVVRYKSFDGTEIPAILYKPHEASATNKVPALVWVHGGPGGQSRLSYFPLLQYLINHGYAVIAVNNRGSSGYGKTFNKMDNKNHGEGDLMDCVKAKDYLASLGYVDMDKIGIIGGSYGGYMVMAALTMKPEAFNVGVNIFGVTNWLRTLKSIPPWWESFKKALYEEMGDPTTDSVSRIGRNC